MRQDINLDEDWKTTAGNDENPVAPAFQKNINDKNWKQVNVPHNWDDYYGYRRLLHGNKHGDAWYRKIFFIKRVEKGKRYFLFFEGVGSYATVYLNEKKVGEHAGGRTTFTIDVTDVIKANGAENILAVRAWHPPFIKDLPWVCGGCSDERGFSEGSQPMGIFRPVHLIVTNEVRIQPFGVHAWANVQPGRSLLNIDVSIKNYASAADKNITILNEVLDSNSRLIGKISKSYRLKGFDSVVISGRDVLINNPVLWSVENPYLYKIKTTIQINHKTVDELVTDFGFRTINWHTATNQFYLNGKPVFINGVAEYEHLLGQSHAFSQEQIRSRFKWLRSAGFNALRDAHQPHNLLYGRLCDEQGILWWTQFSAHIWYDTPEFKENFLALLKDWVIERRNDPAVILWGLQNESKLPESFAKECTQLIRDLDPTASAQRLVTTCNGGQGTDWDVPQNWTGTYGGNPDTYGDDLKKQVLVGEYGAWRTLDLHSEGGFQQNGPVSEDRFTQLMEKKIRLAESVKDSVAGHFFWLLTSHDNPGRVQGGEGLRELDRVGPVNYKGLLTPWEEPTDVYYMFRSNYVSAHTSPMVYIASHTWPNRWMLPGIKDSIIVYSNCDEVELFNDINNASLGKKKQNGIGTHFQWDEVNIKYNVLYAVGYVNGKAVARDTMVLFHLPQSPGFNKLYSATTDVLKPEKGYQYVYRFNCGGTNYLDTYGGQWICDNQVPDPAVTGRSYYQGSRSWTADFPGMPFAFASQRRIFTPVKGTKDWSLFQTFRYGRDQLKFEFPLKDGNYIVDLYFMEPWLGVGGGTDASGMRIFDVAFNGKTVVDDLDIWKEAGNNHALKKSIPCKVTGGILIIDFPEVKAGQAIISAISVRSKIRTRAAGAFNNIELSGFDPQIQFWMDIGDKVFTDKNVFINELPAALFGAEWLQAPAKNEILNFKITLGSDVYIGINTQLQKPAALKDFENTNTYIVTDENGGTKYTVYKKRFEAGHQFRFDDAEDWLVAVLPAVNMQPAYDLKPTTSYKSDVAVLSAGVAKELVTGSERTVVKTNDQVSISWPVTTGVADVYSITVKYNNPLQTDRTGSVQLYDTRNNRMLEAPVTFKLTGAGKWNYATVNTGSMINAGHYQVRLLTKNADGLIISGIDIQ
ncbi:MAG: malectin domain-containing carbohydrate-binding protein [Niabella sp.]